MAPATLTADAALVLSTAQGFLLPLPWSVPINKQNFPAPTTATTAAAAGSSRIPYARRFHGLCEVAAALRYLSAKRSVGAVPKMPRQRQQRQRSRRESCNNHASWDRTVHARRGGAKACICRIGERGDLLRRSGGAAGGGGCTRPPGRTTWRLSCRTS